MENDSKDSKNQPFKPAFDKVDSRKIQRVDFRISENVEVSFDARGTPITGNVLDLSYDGLSLATKNIFNHDQVKFKEFLFTITFPDGTHFQKKGVVCWSSGFKVNYTRMGIRFTNSDTEQEKIQEDYIKISKNLPIIGYLYKDHFYFEKTIFSLTKVSHSFIEVQLYDSDVIIYPGLDIELLLSLQTANSEKLVAKVESVLPGDQNKMVIQASIIDWGKHIESNIINHLMQNPEVTMEDLRKCGFKVMSVSNNFKFRYVKTHGQYLKVLELRHKAYVNANKVSKDKTIEEMAAPLDYKSRILCAFHGNKLIASAAVSFPDNDTILDTERGVGKEIRRILPDKSLCVEISRLCTDPNYRRGDLLVRVFEHIYRIFASSGKKYIITSTDKKLWPIYKGLGFKKTGLEYDHPYLDNLKHYIIKIEVEKGTLASDISFARWNYLYRDMTLHMLKTGEIKLNRFQFLKIRLFSLIGILMNIRKQEKY
ncbi:MAG: PilZ domain-containing protein [Bdellovibrionales bacterium]|nr:PilZ domain-containing protein [Bdellovibrionales bacterium]